MSLRYRGGIISASPPTISTSSASGFWNIIQKMQAQDAGTWPIATRIPSWIGVLANGVGRSVAVDSVGNVYVCGWSNASGTYEGSNNAQIVKYNTNGVILWQRRLGFADPDDRAYGIAVDSSGNVYVCGYFGNNGGDSDDFLTAKYDTNGNIQWRRSLNVIGFSSGYSVAVDSSSNVYVCGVTNSFGNRIQIVKYNTSGNIQWQRILTSGNYGQGVAVDSSGNVYVCGYSSYDIQIAKYDTNGTILWQRSLGESSTYGQGVAVDSSGNVYVCGYSTYSGRFDVQIAKYNTNGTILWQRRLGDSEIQEGYGVAVDLVGNVYVCGIYSNSPYSTKNFLIAKYDTNGIIQWQRRLDGSGINEVYGIAVDLIGFFYVCGTSTVSGNTNFLFAKLPGDGSLTGTYTVGEYSFTYGASSFTDQESSLVVNEVYGNTHSTYTSVTSSSTNAESSLISSTTTI